MYEAKIKYSGYDLSLWEFGSISEISLAEFLDNNNIQFIDKGNGGPKGARQKVGKIIDFLSDCETFIYHKTFIKLPRK